MDDPGSWVAGAGALKAVFDSLRSAIGLVRDARDLTEPNAMQTRAIEDALQTAEKAAKIAEAEIAKALGYELCKCEFPPNIMLAVGYHNERGGGRKGPVYECPKCGQDTAGPWMYERKAPPRRAKKGD